MNLYNMILNTGIDRYWRNWKRGWYSTNEWWSPAIWQIYIHTKNLRIITWLILSRKGKAEGEREFSLSKSFNWYFFLSIICPYVGNGGLVIMVLWNFRVEHMHLLVLKIWYVSLLKYDIILWPGSHTNCV